MRYSKEEYLKSAMKVQCTQMDTNYGRLNKWPLQNAYVLKPRTCEYVILNGKREFK